MHNNAVQFYRIKLETLLINFDAVRRQAGMEMMMGNPMLAQVMGPDEDLATSVIEHEMLICAGCFLNVDNRLANLLDIELDETQEAP